MSVEEVLREFYTVLRGLQADADTHDRIKQQFESALLEVSKLRDKKAHSAKQQ